ncbi:AAA family ATPase [Planctomycetota bacterium]|nr:AAA family ATPase [Planctomycetota bacterium]
MYRNRYQLHSLPFENIPDPRFFYSSEQHREALAAIEYTIRMRKGIVLVTGDVGTGKTTVGRAMLQQFSSTCTIAQILHGHQTGSELIHHIARSLNIESSDDQSDHATVLESLKHFLSQRIAYGKPVILFIDEAQTLSDEALEEIRLISNFDTNTEKLLQLVLIGQPELRDRIAHENMSALRQRIVLAKELDPLSFRDLVGYVSHRIMVASLIPDQPAVKFKTEALRHIYRFTNGIPRLINVICDNALLLGFVKDADEISANMVQQVICDMVPTIGQLKTINDHQPKHLMAGNE